MFVYLGVNLIKINLVTIGDIKESFYIQAINEYKKRLTRFCNLNIVELKESIDKNPATALKKDEQNLQPYLKGYVIALAIEGKSVSSPELANKISKLSLTNSEITFVIGASNGLSKELKNKANELVSFSELTFPHQLMRVIFWNNCIEVSQ